MNRIHPGLLLLVPAFFAIGPACGTNTDLFSASTATTSTTTTGKTSSAVQATTNVTTGMGGQGGDGGTGGVGGVGGVGGDGGEGGGETGITCPDGVTECALGERCRYDAVLVAYECVDDCAADKECGTDLCCPLGAKCENDDSCPLADITIDADRVANTVEFTEQFFAPNSCEEVEGCIVQTGDRRLMKFDLATPNIGDGDMFMGFPEANPELFECVTCHGHCHFETYADYKLVNANGDIIAAGHKQAFCLLDTAPIGGGGGQPSYNCQYQGISAGWMDVYNAELACQWIDITGVPPGDYFIEVRLNYESVLAESDYSNNYALVPVTIEPNSCPNGCNLWDEACCQAGDPCGLAGNGACDCAGLHEWDQAECQSCEGCEIATSCPGGCETPQQASCCSAGDPCGLGGNHVCECAGQSWDDGDCDGCKSYDADCGPPQCTSQCYNPSNSQCCGPVDVCGWANDGFCDCNEAPWDAYDCFGCDCAN